MFTDIDLGTEVSVIEPENILQRAVEMTLLMSLVDA